MQRQKRHNRGKVTILLIYQRVLRLKNQKKCIFRVKISQVSPNTAAQNLYKKCGFKDYGVRRQGPKGELIVMSFLF